MLTSYSSVVQKKPFLCCSWTFSEHPRLFHTYTKINKQTNPSCLEYRDLDSQRRKGTKEGTGSRRHREIKRRISSSLGNGSEVARSQHGGLHSGGLSRGLWKDNTAQNWTVHGARIYSWLDPLSLTLVGASASVLITKPRSCCHHSSHPSTSEKSSPILVTLAVPRAVQTPQRPPSTLTHGGQCRSNTCSEGASIILTWLILSLLMTFTAKFFVLSWFTFCLILVALDLLPLLPAALVSVFAVFLVLVALGTNLVISHMLGKEIGLPLWMPLPVEGNQSKCLCWKGSKRSFSPIPSFHRWEDRSLERLPDGDRARSKAQVFSLLGQCTDYRLYWGGDGGGRI